MTLNGKNFISAYAHCGEINSGHTVIRACVFLWFGSLCTEQSMVGSSENNTRSATCNLQDQAHLLSEN